MKRWLAFFLAVFLLVSTIGQVSMAARMPCGAGSNVAGPHAAAASSAAAAADGEAAHAAHHADAVQSPCHDSGAKDCSEVCKRLCGNVAFVPKVAAEPATSVHSTRAYPPLSASLFTRTSPPDTPPPIA